MDLAKSISLTVVRSKEERLSLTNRPTAERERSTPAEVTGIEKRRRASNVKQGNVD